MQVFNKCLDRLCETKISADYGRDGRLIAVDAINDGRAHMMARRHIAEETADAAPAQVGVA
jgi:hypothetical protein